jgi:hypothetical protein
VLENFRCASGQPIGATFRHPDTFEYCKFESHAGVVEVLHRGGQKMARREPMRARAVTWRFARAFSTSRSGGALALRGRGAAHPATRASMINRARFRAIVSTLSPEPNQSTERCAQPCAGGQKRANDRVAKPITCKCRQSESNACQAGKNQNPRCPRGRELR